MPPKPTAKKEVASNAEPAAPKNTKEDKMQAAMDKFAAELNKESDEEGGKIYCYRIYVCISAYISSSSML